jgi:hypothetical protein
MALSGTIGQVLAHFRPVHAHLMAHPGTFATDAMAL